MPLKLKPLAQRRMLLPLAVLATLCACSSPPTYIPVAGPQIPPLPAEARQPATPSVCLGGCSANLMSERERWRQLLMQAAPQVQPAKEVTTH